MGDTFSRRYGYTGQPRPITIREDAPENLRWFVHQTALEQDIHYGQQEHMLCKLLRCIPADHRQPYEVQQDVKAMIYGCPWYTFYDFVEAVHRQIVVEDAENYRARRAPVFEVAVNQFFIDE